MFGRRKVATLVAEFLGTGVLTLLILSVQRSTIGVPFFVATAAGLAFAMTMYALRETSGAHFNPALTIAAWTARRIPLVNAVLYIAVQLLGAWLASLLYTYYVKNGLQPVGGHFSGRILTAEAVGTGILAFGVASTAYQRLTLGAESAIAGVSYMLGIIAASSAAIGLLNPAVALGVRAWVLGTYVLGPVIGAIVGFNLYKFLFVDSLAAEGVTAAGTAKTPVVARPAKAKRATTSTRAKKSTTKRRSSR